MNKMNSAEITDAFSPLLSGGFIHGLAVGVVDGDTVERVFLGRASDADPSPPDGRTIFEIGSVTKTFTTLLLADMAGRHEVRLDDPIGACLPSDVPAPRAADGREITLLDLATHTSRLPRDPDDADWEEDEAAAFEALANFSTRDLYATIAGRLLDPGIGEVVEYSNIGFGLLGHVLALRAGRPYAELLADRVCAPLGMAGTWITTPVAERSRMADGHGANGEPVSPWAPDALAPAGGIRSTLDDMLLYLRAMLTPDRTPLSGAIRMTHERRVPVDDEDLARVSAVGLGWIINDDHDAPFFWHNGETEEFHSFMAFDPVAAAGIVALANQQTPLLDDAAWTLMERLQDD